MVLKAVVHAIHWYTRSKVDHMYHCITCTSPFRGHPRGGWGFLKNL